MTIKTDMNLTLIDNDYYDITIDDGGDLTNEVGFDTAIIISLFTDARADGSEVPEPSYRRGWFGNTLSDIPNFEIGSKLWLLEQTAATQDTLNKAEDYAAQSLQWMVDQGYASRIDINAEYEDDNSMTLTIDLFAADDLITTKSFSLWENTGD